MVYCSNGKLSVADLKDTVLDIHIEGKLQKEINDIIEELDIILFITKQQQAVIENFILNAVRIMGRLALWSQAKMLAANGEDSERKEELGWFRASSEDLTRKVERYVEELWLLKQSAEATSASVSKPTSCGRR